MKLHIADALFRQTPPNKLYRRSTIGNVRFPVGKHIDDEFWTYQVIANANKLARTTCTMYAYRQQTGSVMHRAFALSRLQAVDAKCQRLEFVQEKFPEFVSDAKVNLWFTCLYMGQMSLLNLGKDDQKIAHEKLLAALKKYPLTSDDKKSIPAKQRVWAALSDISFITTCKLRNCLKIGI